MCPRHIARTLETAPRANGFRHGRMLSPAWCLTIAIVLGLLGRGGLAPSPASASTILGVSVVTLVAQSSLVFEGVVTDHEPAFRTTGGDGRTCVRFDVVDVVKGNDPRPHPQTLCFSGGTVDGMTMQIAESAIPAVGEHGIYFVESTDKPLVNPLFGWSQGHLRIEGALVLRKASGVAAKSRGGRVLSERGRPVVAITPGGAQRAPWISGGVAAGVVEGSADDPFAGLPPDEVKRKLRALLEEIAP